MTTSPSHVGTAAPVAHRLEHFPVALFAMVMGITGLAIAWKKATPALELPATIWQVIAGVGAILFVFLSVIYLLKVVRHGEAVSDEFAHPIRINFFPTISISLLLQATVWAESLHDLARFLWVLGSVMHLTFTLSAVSGWIHHSHYEIKHANPAWFIPVVGNLVIPLAGIQFAPLEVSWFFFSIGIVFWLVLQTIVLNRLFFHEPLPARLTPTLFILMAPPSIGFIAYVGLTGQMDAFARVLFYTAFFLMLLLASNALRFARTPFFISSWAYSFPLAAMTIATFIMQARTGMLFFSGLAVLLLTGLSIVVVILIVRTLDATRRKLICIPE